MLGINVIDSPGFLRIVDRPGPAVRSGLARSDVEEVSAGC
jgi:hypothetical protein